MSQQSLVAELAAALGLPTRTRRAVLTLEAGKLPLLEVEMYVRDGAGHFVLDPWRGDPGKNAAERIKSITFMLRLEPFKD